jgi:hypothetical protein
MSGIGLSLFIRRRQEVYPHTRASPLLRGTGGLPPEAEGKPPEARGRRQEVNCI